MDRNVDNLAREGIGDGYRIAVTVGYIIAAAVYLAWRPEAFNHEELVFSILFYAAEITGFLLSLLIILTSWRVRVRRPPPAPPGLAVDVFVPTYNEPLDVVRRTLLAARKIRYPHETWLLDDGNRSEMKALAAELGVHYLARERNVGAKGGNLNNGLAHAKGAFVALFDADHVAQPDFLDKTLGYFADPKVCLVQTPQDYFNLNSFQHGRSERADLIWHEQSFFHYVGQPGRDHWNAATLCGCSAVIRRSALDEVGGFASVTVTEDMHTAVKMQKRGYRTVFHSEPLAFGIAPTDFRQFLRQRLRWGEGNFQVCREERLPFTRSLSLAQRLCYFALTASYLDGWQKLVYLVTPIFVLFSQITPIWIDPLVFAAFFAPYLAFMLLYFEELGRGYGRLFATEKFGVARFAVSILASFGLVRRRIPFRISSKELGGRLPLLLLAPQIFVFGGSIAALGFTALRPVLDIPLYIPWPLTALIAAFAFYNTVLSGLVLRDAVRAAFNRNEDFRFRISLPAEIAIGAKRTVVTTVREICVKDMILRLPAGPIAVAGQRISGVLNLPTGALPFSADLTAPCKRGLPTPAGGQEWRCAFAWEGRAGDRDRLDLALHAGRWHRAALGQHEYVATPMQMLRRLVRRAARERPRPWLPALYWSHEAGGADMPRYALVRQPLSLGAESRLVLYGARHVPRQIVIRPLEDAEELMWRLEVSVEEPLDDCFGAGCEPDTVHLVQVRVLSGVLDGDLQAALAKLGTKAAWARPVVQPVEARSAPAPQISTLDLRERP